MRSVIAHLLFVLLSITGFHFRLILMFSYLFMSSIVRVEAQICHGVAQYSGCSTNPACGCLHMIGASDTGICGFLYGSCSDLVACQPSSNACFEPDHICVHHPRCHFHPVCFPVSMIDRRICPPITPTNTTIATTTTTTSTAATTTSTSGIFTNSSRWQQNGVTVAGGNGQGSAENQLNHPTTIHVLEDETILIFDSNMSRIVEWKKGAIAGQVAVSWSWPLFGLSDFTFDNETDSFIVCDTQNRRVLRWPRGKRTTNGDLLIDDIDCSRLALDDQRNIYVTNWQLPEVRRFKMGETTGTIVAGGNGKGTGLNQLNSPGYVFVDRQSSVFVSDAGNYRVMKWVKGATEGIVVAGGKGPGNDLTQLNYPNGLSVDDLGSVYVADSSGRIIRWVLGAQYGTVIVGGNGWGNSANQFRGLDSLSFDRQGNIYVSDNYNDRVQRFSIENN